MTTASATRTPVVLVADKMDPDGVTIMEQAGLEVRVQQGLEPDALRDAAQDVDGILVRSASKITSDIIEGAERLRAVGRAGIGVDNIDLTAASRRGVLVMNTPLANATTTAELAIAHMFSLARHTAEAHMSMSAGRWDKGKLTGHEVTGKTLAVIGLGKIGRLAAERGVGLRMEVVAYDPFLTGESPVPGVELVDLDAALARADYLTLHVPKNDATLGLIDADALAKMKPTAAVINCSRGGIVDEAALLAALQDDDGIAAAALDVFEHEPLPEDSPLRNVPNLLLTPHLGASSSEAQKRVSTEIAQQMVDYLLHDEARCAVNAPTVAPEDLTRLRPWSSLARRAGLMLAQLSDEPVARLEICYRGDLADDDTDPVRVAAVTGLLAPSLDGPVNQVNAEALATERGLKILEERDRGPSRFASALRMTATTTEGRVHTVDGTVSQGEPRLSHVEGFGVDFVPAGHLLLTRHRDEPGVLGAAATWLGENRVNIGGLHMSARRTDTDSALALFELDRALTREELDALEALSPIVGARMITL